MDEELKEMLRLKELYLLVVFWEKEDIINDLYLVLCFMIYKGLLYILLFKLYGIFRRYKLLFEV